MRKWLEYFVVLLALLLAGAAHPAEFLIYDQDHWMDALSPETVAEYIKKGKFSQSEYDERYQRGDIVCVYEDGRCKGDGKSWGGHAFRLIRVPQISIGDAMPYSVRSYNTPSRRRFSMTGASEEKCETVMDLRTIQIHDKDYDETSTLHSKLYGDSPVPGVSLIVTAGGIMLGGGIIVLSRHRW